MNTKIFVMLIWSLYLDQQATQQARWFIRQGTWRDMNRKKNQELLSNFRWLNATKRAVLYPDPWEKKTRKRLSTEF